MCPFVCQVTPTKRYDNPLVMSCCSAGTLGDERHLVFECASLAALRAKYSDLFTATTTTMRYFFAQSDHLRVFHYVIDCLNMLRIVIANSWHQGTTASRNPAGSCEMADFAHGRPSEIGPMQSKTPALVGSPLKSSAVTVHLAGSGTISVCCSSDDDDRAELDLSAHEPEQVYSSLIGDEDEDLEAALGLN